MYTWKSPGDSIRNQIDFIMVKDRFRNAIILVKTYPGADINSDHVPVICKVKVKLKIPKRSEIKAILDLNELKKGENKRRFAVEVNNYFDQLSQETEAQVPEEEIDEQWNCLRDGLLNTAKKILPVRKIEKRKDWMTDEILLKIKEKGLKKEDRRSTE